MNITWYLRLFNNIRIVLCLLMNTAVVSGNVGPTFGLLQWSCTFSVVYNIYVCVGVALVNARSYKYNI